MLTQPGSVMTVQVSYKPDEWEDLALERAIPSVQIDVVAGNQLGAQVRITKEDVPARGNLGMSQAGQHKTQQCDDSKSRQHRTSNPRISLQDCFSWMRDGRSEEHTSELQS